MDESASPRPWYREPWPWILAAGPAIAIVGSFATLAIAISTSDGLVAEDYYKQGLAVNQVLAREARARSLGLSASVALDGDTLRLELHGAKGPVPELRLAIVHPTRPGRDQTVVLRESGGAYRGRFLPAPGEQRLLVLEDAGSVWRLRGSWNGRERSAELAP
jgi:uncharacterized protein